MKRIFPILLLISFACAKTNTHKITENPLSVAGDKVLIKENKGKIMFESTGVGIVDVKKSPEDADNMAEKDALKKALKRCGVEINYEFEELVTQHGKKTEHMVMTMLHTWSGALIGYELIGVPERELLLSGSIKSMVRIRGEILSNNERDPSFEIRTDLKGGLGLNKTLFQNGEDIRIAFWITKDSYVNIISVDQNKNSILLYPNKYNSDNFLKSDEVLYFPENGLIKIKAILPEDKKETVEYIYVIASKTEPVFRVFDTKDGLSDKYFQPSLGKISQVKERLAKYDRDEWTMKVFIYRIIGE